ncbi:Rrf2 family transcriptional regulator [Mycoplasma sp. P36-A1]|uniref:Rrf2 family transcriptional regulator n=1 Tax=Mycoplasma sp. P36-A1 TaxID=3252900 RepID=UPI003C2C3B3C
MKLTKGFEKVLVIMAIFASQKPGVPISADIINLKVGGSATYMKKLMRKLVIADIVYATTGNSGGFMLKKPLNEITIYEVFVAIEGELQSYSKENILKATFPNLENSEKGVEAISAAFIAADKLWADSLKGITCQDILDQSLGTDYIKVQDWNEILRG